MVYKKTIFTATLIVFVVLAKAQLSTDVLLSDVQLVKILAGSSGTVITSNVTHSYKNDVNYRPVGSFTVTGINTIGLKNGIVLTTGSAKDSDPDGVNGPNNLSVASQYSDTTILPDPDLQNI